ARLDVGAEIEFLDPPPDLPFVGTLADLRRANQDAVSQAHAAIAKVTYADGKAAPSWLVYVKATLTGDEPVDVLEYHSIHPDFPHESTANQFFDEAQWESYRRLGEHIGSQVLTTAIFDLVNEGPGIADTVVDAQPQFKL
ncbi:MAG TPA: hypothetical protein VJ303_08140, partial [Steroidobacteraceae bacterium]|nr:hypothetical protein [Steroidobacteraceae bacterium]